VPLRRMPTTTAWSSSHLLKRIIRSALVAGTVGLLMQIGAFSLIERPIQDFLFTGSAFGIPGLGLHNELLIITALALIPSALRIDAPRLLAAYAVCGGFVYLMIASVVLLTTERVLPLAPAMLALVASTITVGSVAWGDERRQRERLERQDLARQTFTDMLVHDMKKRMSSILMSLSVLERKSTDPEHEPLIGTIRASAERMLLLASNLLDIRRVEEGRMELDRQALSLHGLVKDAMSEHQFASDLTGIGLQIDVQADAHVSVDRAIFGRVLSNLFWNALQHAKADSIIQVLLGKEQEKAFVSISNRGAPIPEAVRAELFTAFVSGRSESTRMPEAGTGLGLTFCRLAMDAHHGDISLESPIATLGDGVMVTLHLPAS
jgi:signal transduction histidine kinase